jgi:hypothetical protein
LDRRNYQNINIVGHDNSKKTKDTANLELTKINSACWCWQDFSMRKPPVQNSS